MIKSIVFDLGGTLYSSSEEAFEKGYKAQWEEIKEKGHEVTWEEYMEALEESLEKLGDRYGKKVEVYEPGTLVEILFNTLGEDASKKEMKEIGKAFWRNQSKESELKEDAEEILNHLEKHDKHLGVITNGNKIMTYTRLEKDNLKHRFDEVVYSTGVGAQKFTLKPFKIFLERTGLKGEECLMIGNRKDEDMYGKELGMKTVLITEDEKEPRGEEKKPDYKIRKLKELKDIEPLKELQKKP